MSVCGAPSFDIISLVNFVDYFYFNIFIKILYFLPPVFYSMHFEYLILIRELVDKVKISSTLVFEKLYGRLLQL